MASASVATDERSGHSSCRQSRDLIMHFEQCMKASSTVTMRTRLGVLPFTANRRCKRGVPHDPSLAADPQRVVVARNDEDQADLRVNQYVLERVQPVVAEPVGNGERALVQDGHESRRIAFWRDVQPPV